MIPRRAILLLPAFLIACGDDPPPPSYPMPRFDHLPKLELKVQDIEIDDTWAPRGVSRRVDHLSPITPRAALRQMAADRLSASGNDGRAVFIIEDASIVRAPKHYEATLQVRLDMADDSGARLGQATARVVQIRPLGDDSPRAVRDDLYAFVRELMTEMNVEFEFQVRKALKDALQTTSPAAPEPAPVESQPLENPSPEP